MTKTDEAILEAANLPIKERRGVAAGLGLSSPRFHQRLVALLRSTEAEQAYPVEVHRWRRIVDDNRRARTRGC